MKHYQYRCQGTCSMLIDFELDDEKKLHNVVFTGGCNGNLQGIGRLVEGQDAKEIADKIEGVRCGYKPTSCPDQLSRAIRAALAK